MADRRSSTNRVSEPVWDTVPDTLDLAQRGEFALHGICQTVDPAGDALMFFEIHLCHQPPMMRHKGADFECNPEFAEAVPQLRRMSGSNAYADIESQMLDYLVGCISPDDGLLYAPYDPKRPWHGDQHSHVRASEPEDYASPAATAELMQALLFRSALERTNRWDATLGAMARGLERIAIQKDDYAYYPDGGFGQAFTYPRSGWRKTDEPANEHEGGEGSVVSYQGIQIRALARWAAYSGDDQALGFAGKLARFVMKPKFWGGFADPTSGNGREHGQSDSHYHARGAALDGLLEYGLVANDVAACDFVRAAYEYMRSFGIPEIGYIPSFLNGFPTPFGYTNPLIMEGCFLGDLVALSTKLSESGYGDYWEDADRLIRNQLVEAQIIDREMLERVVLSAPERPDSSPTWTHSCQGSLAVPRAGSVPGQDYLGYDVIDRVLGIFWTSVRVDGVYDHFTAQCCTANASRGLYAAWDAITRCDSDGNAQINLFLNRTAPWVNIESYLPYEGKVVIRNKTAHRMSVRIPPWVDRRRLECLLNGRMITPTKVAQHIDVSNLRPGDVVELRFPMVEQLITRTAYSGAPQETVFSIRMRGNTVMELKPANGSPHESPGVYSFYHRAFLRGDVAPSKRIESRVPLAIPAAS